MDSKNQEKFLVDLITLDMSYFDIILGMDWQTKYQAIVNYFEKKITFQTPKGIEVQFYGKKRVNLSSAFLKYCLVRRQN